MAENIVENRHDQLQFRARVLDLAYAWNVEMAENIVENRHDLLQFRARVLDLGVHMLRFTNGNAMSYYMMHLSTGEYTVLLKRVMASKATLCTLALPRAFLSGPWIRSRFRSG